MFNPTQAFTVSIGSNGAVIVLHNGKNIKQKILVTNLNDESKIELTKLFKNNKNSPIYILLDTADQNYKKRTYPPVRKSDLHNLTDRDLKKEIGNDDTALTGSISNFDKKTKKWESVLIFSHRSPEINLWIDFLLQMPGKVMGIYMLPTETNILSNLILGKKKEPEKKADKKTDKKKELELKEPELIDNSHHITFFIVQNKVSGIRQIIFHDDTIIFTRLATFQVDDPKFVEEFEGDIFRTNEYLKRIFPELKIEDVKIINLLPEEILKKISEIKNPQLNFINYTPYEAAKKVGLPNIIAQNSNFADILVSNVFVSSKKKTLKFSTAKIDWINRLYLAIDSFSILNMSCLAAIFAFIINIFIYGHMEDNATTKIMADKTRFEHIYKDIKSKAFNNDEDDTKNLSVDEVMDFGKINDLFERNNLDIFAIFAKFKLISNYNASARAFAYNVPPTFDPKGNTPISHQTFSLGGSLNTPSGDVEDLFKQYDDLSLATKNAFTNYNVVFSELPKDIDFSKKYYTSSFDLTMTGR